MGHYRPYCPLQPLVTAAVASDRPSDFRHRRSIPLELAACCDGVRVRHRFAPLLASCAREGVPGLGPQTGDLTVRETPRRLAATR